MKFKKLPKKAYILIISISIPLILLTSLILITKLSIKSYASRITTSEEFCLDGNFILPTLYKIKTNIPAKREIREKTNIFDKYTIFAKQICFEPLQLLPESQEYPLSISYFNDLDIGVFEKQISLKTENYPKIEASLFQEEVNKDAVIRYKMDDINDLLQYSLISGEQEVECEKDESFLVCDTSTFEFKYGKKYEISLVSKNNGIFIDTLQTRKINILDPIKITKSSIEEGSVIKKKTIDEIILDLNKEILNIYDIKLQQLDGDLIDIDIKLDIDKLYIYPKESFNQGEEYSLAVKNLIGLDNSNLAEEYTLSFSIDDGPSITSSNIKDGFSTSSNIVLYFDQDIDRSENIKDFITVDSGTKYYFSIYNNRVTINPYSSLGFCDDHSVKVKTGIEGESGLVSSRSYSYSFKTTCTRVYSIGKSVEGRSIYAYYLGNGSKKILFYGAMHGSEYNTKYTLTNWIDELEDNIDDIPDDKTVIVVPALNPDGVSRHERFNSNGVDLNRNFDSSTWVSGSYFLDTFYETGGGDTPFSEPESRAIRDLIVREHPYLTLSYHSAAGYVIPSNTSKGRELGQVYASKSGYSYIAPGSSGSFSYDITGAFGEWAQEHGYNSLTVELSSYYYNQFTQNKSAMWEMVRR